MLKKSEEKKEENYIPKLSNRNYEELTDLYNKLEEKYKNNDLYLIKIKYKDKAKTEATPARIFKAGIYEEMKIELGACKRITPNKPAFNNLAYIDYTHSKDYTKNLGVKQILTGITYLNCRYVSYDKETTIYINTYQPWQWVSKWIEDWEYKYIPMKVKEGDVRYNRWKRTLNVNELDLH